MNAMRCILELELQLVRQVQHGRSRRLIAAARIREAQLLAELQRQNQASEDGRRSATKDGGGKP